MQYVTYRNCMYTLKGNTSMANFKITFDHILKAFIKTITISFMIITGEANENLAIREI